MSSPTPLLLLLDSILSQDEADVRSAVQGIVQRLRLVGIDLQLGGGGDDDDLALPLRSTESLCLIIQTVGVAFPAWAQTPSDDGSLPLHFAASLGKPQVARLLLAQVRTNSIDCEM